MFVLKNIVLNIMELFVKFMKHFIFFIRDVSVVTASLLFFNGELFFF